MLVEAVFPVGALTRSRRRARCGSSLGSVYTVVVARTVSSLRGLQLGPVEGSSGDVR
jgi:hypothetical protein